MSHASAERDWLETPLLLAEVDGAATLTDGGPQRAALPPLSPLKVNAPPPGPLREVDTWCQALNWNAYRDYFEPGLPAFDCERDDDLPVPRRASGRTRT